MQNKKGLLLAIFVSLSACTPKKGGGHNHLCVGVECVSGQPTPDCKLGSCPTPIPDPPICEVGDCKPIVQDECPNAGFEEAGTIKEPPMRAAYCISFAKEKKCKATQDFIVKCMSLAGDLDPEAYKAYIARLYDVYNFYK